MSFNEFVIEIRKRGNHSEVFSLMDEYLVSSKIDSWKKLSKILAKKEQFLISFLDFVPYDVEGIEGYDRVDLDVYDYLLSKSSLGKDTPNFNYTFNSSDIPMLYD